MFPDTTLGNPRAQLIIQEAKNLMPPMFLVNANDTKIYAWMELTLNEVNMYPPETGFTMDGMPDSWTHLIPFGANVYAALFLQANLALQEFDFNDNGLSVRTSFVGQLDTAYKNLLAIWERRMLHAKNNVLVKQLPVGIGTPRFQASIGQFLKITFGAAYPSGTTMPYSTGTSFFGP